MKKLMECNGNIVLMTLKLHNVDRGYVNMYINTRNEKKKQARFINAYIPNY